MIVLFLPPALLVFTVLVILPMGEAAWYSFFNWNGYGTPEKWVGLRNYQLIFRNGAFTTALKNNALIILISLLVQIPLALWLASMVSKRFPGALAFRLIFFLPFVLADVAAGMIWRFVYDGDFGLVAGVSRFIGVEPPFWLADRDVAMYAILGVIVWKYFGFHMMLFIAGLQAIDQQCARGGYIGFFWHVTLPLSRPIIATVGIISFVASWNSYIIPLIMLNTESRYPWPLGIMVYKGEFSTEWQLVLAFITLTILPTVIAFIMAQKRIIAGLTAGAVKS